MMEYIPQALGSLGAATKILSSLMKLRDFSNYAATFTELQGHIIEANAFIISEQDAHVLSTKKIQELEEECLRFKNWDAERQKYSRREIAGGIFAYVENGTITSFERAHKYCCNCFDNYKKSTLQQFHVQVGRLTGLSCHNKCPDLVFRNYLDVK